MGASGSGKTTLLNCISTIDNATAGHIYLDGEDITTLKASQLSKFRREKLGFIFQDFNLLDTLTGFENIALALTIMKVPAKEIEARVQKVAGLLNITDVLFEVKIPVGKENDVKNADNDIQKIPIIISIQNQSDISYVMPVRVINADANGYYLQWKDIERKHKREKQTWADHGEFLSKFKESDRLKPILTIVIYFGKDDWNGAKSLKEITNLKVCPLHIQKQMQDYSINLIEVRNFSDVEKFTTDLREVFGFLQNDGNKQQLEKYVEKHREGLLSLEEDAYDLICVMSDMKKLQELKSEIKTGGRL